MAVRMTKVMVSLRTVECEHQLIGRKIDTTRWSDARDDRPQRRAVLDRRVGDGGRKPGEVRRDDEEGDGGQGIPGGDEGLPRSRRGRSARDLHNREVERALTRFPAGPRGRPNLIATQPRCASRLRETTRHSAWACVSGS